MSIKAENNDGAGNQNQDLIRREKINLLKKSGPAPP